MLGDHVAFVQEKERQAEENETLKAYVKKFEKIKGPQKTVCHAVAVTLRLADEFDELTNVKFARVKDSCGIASVEQVFDPTFYFPETLFTLIQNITKQFSKSGPSKEWLITHAKKTPDAMEQIIRGRKLAFEDIWDEN